MSDELANARRQLGQISSLAKQDKAMPAAQALQSALGIVLRQPLMKAERMEFSEMIANAVVAIANMPRVRKHYALALTYEPGQGKALYEQLVGLQEVLQQAEMEDAQARMREVEERKRNALNKAADELARGQVVAGKATLAMLVREYPVDFILRGRAGEILLKAGLYEEAVEYLTAAIDGQPDMLFLYSAAGIALRKLGKFDIAESYFLRGSQYLRNEPNLYFNIGRLYIDWQKWDKAIMAAKAALQLKPDFEEARKMLDYAENQKEKLV